MAEHLPVLSIMVLFSGAFLIAIFGGKNRVIRNIIAAAAILSAFLMIILLIKPVLIDGNIVTYWLGDRVPQMEFSIGIGLEIDGLNLMFALAGIASILIAGIYSFGYIGTEDVKESYHVLFLMLSGSILGILFTGDMFNMIIMMALMTFASVGLTAFKKGSEGNFKAAFRLMIIDMFSLMLIFLGTIMLYKQFQTLNMAQIAAMLHNNYTPVTLFAFAALLGGFSGRSYLIPSHAVYRDVCEAAPAPVSMLFSGIAGMTGVYGIIRVIFIVYTSMGFSQMRLVFLIWGTITMLLGALMALGEKNLKGFLSYQSMSQAGYVFLAIGLSTVPGLTAGLYHALNIVFFMGLLFLCTGAFLHAGGSPEINRLNGIGKKMPITSLIFLMGASAICGLPPFNGFVSKWSIHELLFRSGYTAIAVLALITSLISIISFMKVIKEILYGQPSEENQNITEVPRVMRIPMWIMAAICAVSGALPEVLEKYLITPAVSSTLNVGKYIDTMMGMGFAEKWFGEPLINTAASYAFPEYLQIVAQIFLLVLIVLVLAAAVGAFGPNIFENICIDTKQSIACALNDRKGLHLWVEKRIKGIKKSFFGLIGFIRKNFSGNINDYVLYVFSTTAILLIYFFIFL